MRPSTILMRILIADDSQAIRKGVKVILAPKTNWEVCGEAEDGAEAVQKAGDLIPDLILLDISMPGLSGLEAARLLRIQVPATRILIMSQHDPVVLTPLALAAGANGCIDKSCLSTNLVPAIEDIEKRSGTDRIAGAGRLSI